MYGNSNSFHALPSYDCVGINLKAKQFFYAGRDLLLAHAAHVVPLAFEASDKNAVRLGVKIFTNDYVSLFFCDFLVLHFRTRLLQQTPKIL